MGTKTTVTIKDEKAEKYAKHGDWVNLVYNTKTSSGNIMNAQLIKFDNTYNDGKMYAIDNTKYNSPTYLEIGNLEEFEVGEMYTRGNIDFVILHIYEEVEINIK